MTTEIQIFINGKHMHNCHDYDPISEFNKHYDYFKIGDKISIRVQDDMIHTGVIADLKFFTSQATKCLYLQIHF